MPLEKGGKEYVKIVALFDTGSSFLLIDETLVEEFEGFDLRETKDTGWNTKTGTFTTSKSIILEGFRIPQFTTKRKVEFDFNVFKKRDGYDAILGRDFGQSIDINLSNKSKTFVG